MLKFGSRPLSLTDAPIDIQVKEKDLARVALLGSSKQIHSANQCVEGEDSDTASTRGD